MNLIWARAVPYLITLTAGLIVLWLSTLHPDSIWGIWLVEISGALSSIPIIFLIYDYTNSKMAARVNKSLVESLTFEINSTILKIIILLRAQLRETDKLSWESINLLFEKTPEEIAAHINLNARNVVGLKSYKYALKELKLYKATLDDLVYKAAADSVFDDYRFKLISGINRELTMIINELELRRDKKVLSNYIINLLELINDWFDSCEEDALKSHTHFQTAFDLDKLSVEKLSKKVAVGLGKPGEVGEVKSPTQPVIPG